MATRTRSSRVCGQGRKVASAGSKRTNQVVELVRRRLVHRGGLADRVGDVVVGVVTRKSSIDRPWFRSLSVALGIGFGAADQLAHREDAGERRGSTTTASRECWRVMAMTRSASSTMARSGAGSRAGDVDPAISEDGYRRGRGRRATAHGPAECTVSRAPPRGAMRSRPSAIGERHWFAVQRIRMLIGRFYGAVA